LQPNRIYTFTRGSVKAANPRFDRGQYVLTFDDHSQIEDEADDIEIPGVSYNFMPVAQVLATNAGSTVDVSGVLSSLQETVSITMKTGSLAGQERPKRTCTLWDNSGDEGGSHVEFTLWGEKAHMDFQVGHILFIKAARTGEWQNRITLNTGGSTGFELNPDHPRTFELKRQWLAAGSPSGAFITGSTSSGNSGGAIGYQPGRSGMVRETIEQCYEEDVNLGPISGKDTHRHLIIGTLTGAQTDRQPFYCACPEMVERQTPTQLPAQLPDGAPLPRRLCNKKVVEENGMWRCAAGHACQQPNYRYLFRTQLTDYSGNLDATLFDDCGAKLFGHDADALAKLWNEGQMDEVQDYIQRATLWKTYAMRLRAQKENFNSEERVKYVVMELAEIPLVAEANDRLAQIKAAIGEF